MNDAGQRYLDFGEFRLDTSERLLTRRGEQVPITVRCYHLLLTFLNNSGHLLTHEELMRSVWEGTAVDRSSLKQTIAALRKTLGDVHEQPQYIQTVPKFGYRFIADITSRSDADVVLVAERRSLTVIDYEERTSTEGNWSKPIGILKSWPVMGLVTIALAVGALAYWNLLVRSGGKPDFLSYSWRSLSADNEAVTAIAPNGEFIIFSQHADRTDSLKMRRLAGEEAVTIVQNISPGLWGLAISHDNNYVYYILSERASSPTAGSLYRVSVLGGQPRKILEGITGGPTLSPDDRRVAFIRDSNPRASQLITADAGDGSDERVVSSSDLQPQLWNPAWSPDGQKIVCFTREKRDDGMYFSLVEIPPAGGDIKKITEPNKRYIWWHTWMHDESGLLAVRSDDVTNLRQLVFISYPDGAISKISNDLNQYSAMTVSDSGEKIVTNRYERQSNIVITDENESESDAIKLNACCPDTVSWMSDKQIVFDAFADGKRSLWTMSVDGADQRKFFSTDTQDWSPSVSPDGQSVIFLSTRSGSKQIWKCNANGSKLQQLTQLESDVDSPQYSSDGFYVYFSLLADNKWKIARIEATGGEPQMVVDENADSWDVSPDGKSIAYTYWPEDAADQSIAVNDIDTKELKYRFDIASKYILHWTPDGRQLIYEQADPSNTSFQMLMRQNVLPGSSRSAAVKLPLQNYLLDISPDGHRYAYIRGHLVSSAAMLVRK